MVFSKFVEFSKKVMAAAKKGGLKAADLAKLGNLLKKTGNRNRILAQGILSALAAGGSSKEDIHKFGELLELANERIADGKTPFTSKQQEELNTIFARAYVSRKTARWFSLQLDELVAGEINDFLTSETKLRSAIPEKKTFKLQEKQKTTQQKEKKVKL